MPTADYERSVAFYSVLFEQSTPRRIGRIFNLKGPKLDAMSGLPNAKVKMAFFQSRNLELEIAEYVSHPTTAPTPPRPLDALGFYMIVFEVSDIDRAKSKLIEAGETVVTEPTSMDGGTVLFGRDPDGNLLGFQVLDPSSPLSAARFKNNGI